MSKDSKENPPVTQIITLPFPPIITAQDVLDRRSSARALTKSPNAFFVYRKAFVYYLQICNYNLKMRDVSSMAGLSWKAASNEVKDAYKKISREVEKHLAAQRKKKVEEPSKNQESLSQRPVLLETPYQVHSSSTPYLPQQPPPLSEEAWITISNHNQHFQPRQEINYDFSPQYNDLSQLADYFDIDNFVFLTSEQQFTPRF
ncbi:20057_t:CDS:2 [Funneliformis geosporum]|uniref:20057_t:CDS:1 n=1 Tax=Funneliformis geosporum TaxID=1117311 RepID=A0A9W4WL39_9GLOM|nr:20057_t:CDS:2 [Funneliformis geosporum]